MAQRIDSNGLSLSLVKLNGKLELRFTVDKTFVVQYTFRRSDIDDTVEIEYAREAASGQSIVSLGLEMFLEDVHGFLEVRFDGAFGSTLAFQYDGRNFEDLPTYQEIPQAGPSAAADIATGNPGLSRTQLPVNEALLNMHDFQEWGITMRDAKIQTVSQATRSAKIQTTAPFVKHAGVQIRAKCMIGTGVQTSTKSVSLEEELDLFPNVVDLTEHDETIPIMNYPEDKFTTVAGSAHTFTNAVATVFQTFNEPRDPYRQKRQAEPAADYRAYKHIFIEGYRNGDEKEEEGRLQVDLVHHVLLWESYNEYEDGAKLTLDRLDLPRYYKGKEAKIYGNNAGGGDERSHFIGPERVQVVLDAIQECLEFKAKYVAPRLD
ncbi:hypothetical protein EK21DRAFT_99859 [Setomelanomma holmii]|uniref:Uncharacterized protein n=1 Tax=Setomelanomma holmii TaxID=210430 RepID=A0A9P4HDG1_9PLEO|nr:hypothetical protein EK21DRAFT_99859 [Setomelanomma holmii]